MKHLALALTRYVRHLRDGGILVPPELEELTVLLVRCARSFPGAEQVDGAELAPQHGALAGRLLVTKAEAAEYLHVSVRTVDRLILAGKLPLLHIERASRTSPGRRQGVFRFVVSGESVWPSE